jgi:hypothetical protein
VNDEQREENAVELVSLVENLGLDDLEAIGVLYPRRDFMYAIDLGVVFSSWRSPLRTGCRNMRGGATCTRARSGGMKARCRIFVEQEVEDFREGGNAQLGRETVDYLGCVRRASLQSFLA